MNDLKGDLEFHFGIPLCHGFRGQARDQVAQAYEGDERGEGAAAGQEVTTTPQPQIPPFALRSVRDPRRDTDLLEATEGRYAGSKIEPLRDASGQVSYLRFGGRLYVRQEHVGGKK